MKQYIKETHFYHPTFLFFFMCNDLPFFNTVQNPKNSKTFQKNVWIPRMDGKKLYTRELHLKGIDGNMRCKLLQKKGLLEKQLGVPNTCDILPLKKIFFSELNWCIFQIPLKYIKLVIPEKILFILVLCNFNFYFKITSCHKRKIPQKF